MRRHKIQARRPRLPRWARGKGPNMEPAQRRLHTLETPVDSAPSQHLRLQQHALHFQSPQHQIQKSPGHLPLVLDRAQQYVIRPSPLTGVSRAGDGTHLYLEMRRRRSLAPLGDREALLPTTKPVDPRVTTRPTHGNEQDLSRPSQEVTNAAFRPSYLRNPPMA